MVREEPELQMASDNIRQQAGQVKSSQCRLANSAPYAIGQSEQSDLAPKPLAHFNYSSVFSDNQTPPTLVLHQQSLDNLGISRVVENSLIGIESEVVQARNNEQDQGSSNEEDQQESIYQYSADSVSDSMQKQLCSFQSRNQRTQIDDQEVLFNHSADQFIQRAQLSRTDSLVDHKSQRVQLDQADQRKSRSNQPQHQTINDSFASFDHQQQQQSQQHFSLAENSLASQSGGQLELSEECGGLFVEYQTNRNSLGTLEELHSLNVTNCDSDTLEEHMNMLSGESCFAGSDDLTDFGLSSSGDHLLSMLCLGQSTGTQTSQAGLSLGQSQQSTIAANSIYQSLGVTGCTTGNPSQVQNNGTQSVDSNNSGSLVKKPLSAESKLSRCNANANKNGPKVKSKGQDQVAPVSANKNHHHHHHHHQQQQQQQQQVKINTTNTNRRLLPKRSLNSTGKQQQLKCRKSSGSWMASPSSTNSSAASMASSLSPALSTSSASQLDYTDAPYRQQLDNLRKKLRMDVAPELATKNDLGGQKDSIQAQSSSGMPESQPNSSGTTYVLTARPIEGFEGSGTIYLRTATGLVPMGPTDGRARADQVLIATPDHTSLLAGYSGAGPSRESATTHSFRTFCSSPVSVNQQTPLTIQYQISGSTSTNQVASSTQTSASSGINNSISISTLANTSPSNGGRTNEASRSSVVGHRLLRGVSGQPVFQHQTVNSDPSQQQYQTKNMDSSNQGHLILADRSELANLFQNQQAIRKDAQHVQHCANPVITLCAQQQSQQICPETCIQPNRTEHNLDLAHQEQVMPFVPQQHKAMLVKPMDVDHNLSSQVAYTASTHINSDDNNSNNDSLNPSGQLISLTGAYQVLADGRSPFRGSIQLEDSIDSSLIATAPKTALSTDIINVSN